MLTSEPQYLERYREAEDAYEKDDMTRAVALFAELAEHGVPEACQYLGLIYKSGDGVRADEEVSRSWYLRYHDLLLELAKKGNLEASLVLGKLYQYGDNIEVDESKAFTHISYAAESGLPEAQFHLAQLFLHGWCGLEQDYERYEYWLDKAITGEYPEALYTKGIALISGDLTHEDGVMMINRASELGFWPANDYLQRKSWSSGDTIHN